MRFARQTKQKIWIEVKNKLSFQKSRNMKSIIFVSLDNIKKKLKYLSGYHELFHVSYKIINK